MIKTISISDLRNKLAAVKGATFVTISALTDARAKKTGNPFVSVLKLSKVNGTIAASYENSVNRQLDREDKGQLSFTAKERSWGTKVSPCLVEHKGEHYLTIMPRSTRKPVYFGKQANGFLKQVPKDSIAAFLPAHRPATNQGTDKEIVTRDYALSGIGSIVIGGETFRIRGS